MIAKICEIFLVRQITFAARLQARRTAENFMPALGVLHKTLLLLFAGRRALCFKLG